MTHGVLDLVGITGVVILVIAYLLLQLNRLQSSGLLYSFLNFLGACLIIVSLIVDFNLSAFLMEAFWVLISLIGIFRHLRGTMLRPDTRL